MNKLILLIALFFVVEKNYAQDIHFSNYYAFSHNINPGLIGNFNGTYRIGAIYRNQGLDYLGGASFSTPGVYADVPVFTGHLNRDKIALGVMFYNDRAGKASINNINASLGLAYHRGLGKNLQSQISVGFQASYLNKRLDNSAVVFYDQFDQITWSGSKTSADLIPANTLNLFDFNAGIYFKSSLTKKVGFQIGGAVYHINEPSESLIINNTSFKLPMRFTSDLSFRIQLNDRWSISPDALYQQINNNKELMFGARAEYNFLSGFRNNSSLHFGTRYRWDDAIVALVAVEFKNCTLGMSYDFNSSSLNQSSNLRGGFEVSLVFIGEDIKHYNARKSLPCPRF